MSVCNCEPETPGVLECGLGCACRCHELEAQLAECRAVLKEVEWAGYWDEESVCPICEVSPKAFIPPRHAPDCRLAKCLTGL